ncbi:MAG: hypothetical protein ACOC1K_03320 [Nanoarchaeota archaeon]
MQKLKCNVNAVFDGREQSFFIDIEIPECKENILQGCLQKRYLKNEITRKFKKTPAHIRSCYIEDIQKNTKEPKFHGKSILEFNEDDFQDFATEFDIRSIPLRKSKNLTDLRNETALYYLKKFKGISEEDIDELYAYDSRTGEKYKNYKVLENNEYKKLLTIKSKNVKEDKSNVNKINVNKINVNKSNVNKIDESLEDFDINELSLDETQNSKKSFETEVLE